MPLQKNINGNINVAEPGDFRHGQANTARKKQYWL